MQLDSVSVTSDCVILVLIFKGADAVEMRLYISIWILIYQIFSEHYSGPQCLESREA